ncbi:7944_t:CDS:1 [Funneliformis geosporum]|uniref:7944_t:CDS:1 n=1 Tax=Funneliformis geosporum TaxID=1117311 RepID=A0A9W4SYY0_9GLOM|nr:7944_t:CDS:1 [Funneliformis geosporum]
MVLHEAFRLKGCRKLQDYCLDYICEEPKPFFNSEISKLEKIILLGLIRKDYLRVKEIDLWIYLIKWGIAQNAELKGKDMTNLSNWDKKDFITLKKTLNQFITHIRFFVISSTDFYEKVQPFAEVLPKKLYEEILSYHDDNIQPSQDNILLPRQGKVFVESIIINRQHAAILANWIQGNDPFDRIPIDVRYNLELIYHGSRDGYDIDTVRMKCHNQGPCILVMKIEEDDAIIGGYNPHGWNHVNTNYAREINFSWIDTNDSFIFSLDEEDLKNIKISRVVDNENAIYKSNFYNYKLNFGNRDLVVNVNDNFGTCNQSHYESCILDSNFFLIKEIEILKIVKREILQNDS